MIDYSKQKGVSKFTKFVKDNSSLIPHDHEYHALLDYVLMNGEVVRDRTGVGTMSVFGAHMTFDLSIGFPLITTKRLSWRSIEGEFKWLCSGSTNNNDLRRRGATIWDEWAREDGDLGLIYGHQWRSFNGKIDQLCNVVHQIQTNPNSRRLIVTGWNPQDIAESFVSLPPCHTLFQFSVRHKQYLDCQLYQRSGDMFLGVPYNIASYALMTHVIAGLCGLEPGVFHHVLGDAHIYLNHIPQVEEQLSRSSTDAPHLTVQIHDYATDKFFNNGSFTSILHNYFPRAKIEAEVAV
jgi:thymidylate synthase